MPRRVRAAYSRTRCLPHPKGGHPSFGALLHCPHLALPRYCGGAVRTAGSCEGNLSRFSSSRASYPSPAASGRSRSFRRSSSPHRTRFAVGGPSARLGLGRLCRLTAGLQWGPPLRCPSVRARTPLTDYSVVHFSAVQPHVARFPTAGHTGANTAFQGPGGCHPAHRRATRGLTARNRGDHVSGSADPTCAGLPPASVSREILSHVPSKSA